ncbi:sulfite exporter TauE/SafE family protein [Candidatus Micrarchaeota archaeon]|nr:sulfite exporter TauE/SafE family protein [Candidatus Micrarchaeota archaeon]
MGLMNFLEAMGTSDIPIIAAFFIGIMMAISPCPMATNITAIAYISKNLEHGKKTLLVGFSYTLGRTLTYVALASLIVWFGVNVQMVALGLQKYGEILLGPLLLIIGIVMLDIIKIKAWGESRRLEGLKESLSKKGLAGSFLLGVLFALAFCPFSAVLFFGMLLPLAIASRDGILIPSIFAFATGLPVILSSLLLVHSVSTLGTVMGRVQAIERMMRRVVAAIFLLVGAYYTLDITLGGI